MNCTQVESLYLELAAAQAQPYVVARIGGGHERHLEVIRRLRQRRAGWRQSLVGARHKLSTGAGRGRNTRPVAANDSDIRRRQHDIGGRGGLRLHGRRRGRAARGAQLSVTVEPHGVGARARIGVGRRRAGPGTRAVAPLPSDRRRSEPSGSREPPPLNAMGCTGLPAIRASWARGRGRVCGRPSAAGALGD